MRTNGDADGEALDVEIATQFRGSVLLPVGSRFIDERTRQNATLAELSACRWDISDPSASTVIFLSDMGELWHIDVRIEGGRLVGVSPRRRTPLSRAGAGASSIDSEGLEFAPGSDGSHVLVSTEEHARANTRASFLDVASYALADGEYRASPFEGPEVVRAQVRNNAGFEALAHTADGKYVATANEVRTHRACRGSRARYAPCQRPLTHAFARPLPAARATRNAARTQGRRPFRSPPSSS